MRSITKLMTAAVLLALIGACADDSSDTGDTGDTGGTDSGELDANSQDAGDTGELDVADTGTSDGDTDAEVSCSSAPAVMVGGTTATDAVANAPARCGQPAHTWLRDDSLGTLVDIESTSSFPATVIDALAQAANLDQPRPADYGAAIIQFSYVTQDRGVLVEATGLMGWPIGVESGTELDVIAMPPGFNGVADDCAWSRKVDAQGLVAIVASYGYLAVMPDYVGKRGFGVESEFDHPALAGQPEAISTLDAVRAVLKFDPAEREDLCASRRFAVIGPSQGGHAALWTQRLAPYYAGELEFVGGAAIVPNVDLTGQTSVGMTTSGFAVKNAAFMAPLAAWYGTDLATVALDPDALVAAAADECPAAGAYPSLADETNETVFEQDFITAATNGTLGDFGTLGCIFVENSITSTSIPPLGEQAPMLFIVATDDDAIDTDTQRSSFDTLCDGTIPLRYLECSGVNHHNATFVTADSAIDFVDALFAGDDVGADCMQSTAVACE